MRIKDIFCFVLLFALSLIIEAEPIYINLTKYVNTPIEDDGIANNAKGGWSDEGINDMFIYPPVVSGKVSRNGFKFEILPIGPDKNTVIMLKGEDNSINKPEEVKISIPSVKAQFIYILQNAVKQSKGQSKNFIVANYILEYSDGTTEVFPIRDGIEIRQWWTGSWWENSGEKSWPFFIGRNLYSMKWGQLIGVWATQLKNPFPEKEINAIILRSEKKSIPVIWAITLDNDDYYKSPDLKKDYVRPPDVPAGYFDGKQAIENKLIFEVMKKNGYAKGIRKVDIISDDIIAVTIDAALSGGAGMANEKVMQFQKPQNFLLSEENSESTNSKAQFYPISVGRQSWNFDTIDVEDFPLVQIYFHTYYLKTPQMKKGMKYSINIPLLENAEVKEIKFEFTEQCVTPVIKVNQAAYFSKSNSKFAYLGWWAGDIGPVDYSKFKEFKVVSNDFKKTFFEGTIKKRKGSDEKVNEEDVSGEIVYEMDISELKKTGIYRIVVPGLGSSYSFGIGVDEFSKIYQTVLRGFLFQRCGYELNTEFCRFNRPACHLKNYESGHLVYGANEKYQAGKHIIQFKPQKKDEEIREFRGGWHDAGDYDLFYSHMISASKMLIAYEYAPNIFKDGDASSPENKNNVPDILDEVEWGLKFYADNQQADGGIFAGRANDEDYGNKEWKSEFAKWKEKKPEWKKYGDLPPFGNFFPCSASCDTFAAVAAQTSRNFAKIAPNKAKKYLEQAEKAYDWARKNSDDEYAREGISYGKIEWKTAWIWAASELFKTTGKQKYNDDVIKLANDKENPFKVHWAQAHSIPFFQFAYASCNRPQVNKDIKKKFYDNIIKSADEIIKNNDRRAYRMGSRKESGGWGNLVGGGYYGEICVLAYILSKEKKFLDAASINADYQLGANPLSRSFISGIGENPVIHPELRKPLYDKNGIPAEGIPVFGPGGNENSLGESYPSKVPIWRRWIDNRVSALHCEFTVGSTQGEAILLYGILNAEENK
ncbi:MAG TPA: glycoside hydrolase family 9 protein [Victivallales bacterium]|nr:glycoside hydrolase family 9 protein [Victivallales bacterium]